MPKELKPPIIILGNFRSGTTMLQKLIANHPNVVPLSEPVGLWLYADPNRNHDEFDEKDATDKVKRYIRSQFLKYQQQNGDRIIVEKTPHNILRIPYVHALFPEAHFIYIVRNPLAFVSSVELKWQQPATSKRILKRLRMTPITQLQNYIKHFLNQQWNNRILKRKYLSIWGPRYKGIQEDLKIHNLMTVIARQWSRSLEKAEKDLALLKADKIMKFRYEDFVQNPVSMLNRICAHCELQMTSEMVKITQETVKRDRNLKWQRFEPHVLNQIIPELYKGMQKYGYEIPAEIAKLSNSTSGRYVSPVEQ